MPDEIQEWIDDFKIIIHNNHISDIAHSLCMMGVDKIGNGDMYSKDYALNWLTNNQMMYNGMVRKCIPNAMIGPIKAYIIKDLKTPNRTLGPEYCRSFLRTWAEWCVNHFLNV